MYTQNESKRGTAQNGDSRARRGMAHRFCMPRGVQGRRRFCDFNLKIWLLIREKVVRHFSPRVVVWLRPYPPN